MKAAPWQASCRVVAERRRAQQDARHVSRLANVRASVDMRPPKALKYKKKNAKRIYMEKERNSRIQVRGLRTSIFLSVCPPSPRNLNRARAHTRAHTHLPGVFPTRI